MSRCTGTSRLPVFRSRAVGHSAAPPTLHGWSPPIQHPPDTSRLHEHSAAIRVLASGSAGNCTILRTGSATLLIDAGLSPRRTRTLLAESGLTLDDLDGILVTHFDSDHFHAGWARALPEDLPVYLHREHESEARRRGLLRRSCRTFERSVAPADDLSVFALLCAHDDVGTASFRFEFPSGSSLGFATDVGRVTDRLAEHLECVDVLAIESNYCPKMQAASNRPAFLKRRVTGGSGHLSNHEAFGFIEDVSPRDHVVLLHLSRECNDPALVAALHAESAYGLTIANQHEPTAWIPIGQPVPPGVRVVSHRIARPTA